VTLIVAVTSVLLSNASPQADLLRHIWLASVPIQAHTFSRLASSGEYLWTPPSKKSIGGPWRGFFKENVTNSCCKYHVLFSLFMTWILNLLAVWILSNSGGVDQRAVWGCDGAWDLHCGWWAMETSK
jgi:hypothetical protein